MPELHWEGKASLKDKIKNIPLRLLNFKPDLSCGDNSQNMIIHGDNLDAMKALLPLYRARVKCIYIDPPYNTGAAFENYNDNFPHADWLNDIYPRLQLLREFLSDDGAIFISIDDSEQAYLKIICDEIFGRNNFVANFSWRKRVSKSDVPYGISQDYEYILCYAKKDFLAGRYIERKYYETADFPNRAWRTGPLTKQTSASERPNSFFTIINPKNGEEFPASHLRTWAITKETFQKYYDADKIIFPGDYDFLKISKPVMRYWKDDDIKKAGGNFGITSVSTHLPPEVGMTQDGTKEITNIFGEKKFAFPKPSSLIQYLISIATLTDKNSIILDAYAGSGTTAHAVINLNQQDGGSRRFILIEIKDYCETITAERVKRIGGDYKYYETGEKILEGGTINPAVTNEELAKFIWYSETQTPLQGKINSAQLGIYDGAAIYLLHGETNILTQETLAQLPLFDGAKIIYGAACRLGEKFLKDEKITFRQIPQDLKLS